MKLPPFTNDAAETHLVVTISTGVVVVFTVPYFFWPDSGASIFMLGTKSCEGQYVCSLGSRACFASCRHSHPAALASTS